MNNHEHIKKLIKSGNDLIANDLICIVKIEEREHNGKWIVTGWYENEKKAFKVAQEKWEQRQQEKWEKESKLLTSEELFNLIGVDDYFRWNVITPEWFLHSDRTWHKSLAKNGETYGKYSGEFPTKKLAGETLCLAINPYRFEDYNFAASYQNHLNSAREPISYLKKKYE